MVKKKESNSEIIFWLRINCLLLSVLIGLVLAGSLVIGESVSGFVSSLSGFSGSLDKLDPFLDYGLELLDMVNLNDLYYRFDRMDVVDNFELFMLRQELESRYYSVLMNESFVDGELVVSVFS